MFINIVRRKKHLKVSLFKDQIDCINGVKSLIDGVEVQLLRFTDDLSLLALLEVPIYSIHYYIKGKTVNPCEIRYILSTKEEVNRFKSIVEVAKIYKSAITIHIDAEMKDWNKEFYKDFLESIKDSGVPILLENITTVKNSQALIKKIPGICTELNKQLGGEHCFPLLDTCHAMITVNSTIDPDATMLDYIKMFYSNKQAFHLSEAVSDGIGDQHGINFKRNKKYLFLILDGIKSVNPDSNIVIEVLDKNHCTKGESLELLSYIKEWESLR